MYVMKYLGRQIINKAKNVKQKKITFPQLKFSIANTKERPREGYMRRRNTSRGGSIRIFIETFPMNRCKNLNGCVIRFGGRMWTVVNIKSKGMWSKLFWRVYYLRTFGKCFRNCYKIKLLGEGAVYVFFPWQSSNLPPTKKKTVNPRKRKDSFFNRVFPCFNYFQLHLRSYKHLRYKCSWNQ